MRETSALYKRLLADPNHYYETRVVIGYEGDLVDNDDYRIVFGDDAINIGASSPDDGYTEEEILSVETSGSLFSGNTPSVGNCVSGEIDLVMLKPSGVISRMAEMLPYIRICTDSEHSEWYSKGCYYIDTRSTTHDDENIVKLTLHGYDSMLKAESMYPAPPESQIDWETICTFSDSNEEHTFLSANYPKLMKNLKLCVGKTLYYSCTAEGMKFGSGYGIGTLQFRSGDTEIATVSNNSTFAVTSDIANSDSVTIYGSSSGAKVYNYTFSSTDDSGTIKDTEMVKLIINQLNSDTDPDIPSTDVRMLHISDNDIAKMDKSYMFPTVASTYTCREVLSMIAAAYGGNWYIDDENYLRLVLLSEMISTETFVITDESGQCITFGLGANEDRVRW